MSTHNIGFIEDCQKLSFNYHQISSNTHLISSSELVSVAEQAGLYLTWM